MTPFLMLSFVIQEADKNFKRLTLKQPMGLKYLGLVISVKEVKKVRDGLFGVMYS